MAKEADAALDVVSDSRGRITLYDGPLAVCRVDKKGQPRPVKRPPSWHRVKKVHLIEGQTLNRVHIVKRSKRMIEAIVKVVPASQRKKQCDTCPKQHSPHNPTCSANLGLATFATRSNHLYSITTRADLGPWRTDSEFLGSATVGTTTYFK